MNNYKNNINLGENKISQEQQNSNIADKHDTDNTNFINFKFEKLNVLDAEKYKDNKSR
jgi:hypothetical protein